MCQLNIYICIGYILPTIGGYMTVGGCQSMMFIVPLGIDTAHD